MKHTKGPWRYLPSIGRVLGPESNTVADCRFKNGIPDGHLIAAAPELLDALREINGERMCTCKLNPLVGAPVPCDTCQLNALIAKAEGR